MGTREVGFGIIGLGMGAARARDVHQTPGARLVAVSSLDADRRQRVSSEFGCPAHEDYRRLLHDPDIDCIVVMTPSGTHGKFAIEAMEAGKHVIVTKPMEVTVARCDQMVRKAEETGVKLAVDFEMRFTEQGKTMKQALESGALGQPLAAEARLKWYRSQEYYEGWRGTWALDGGGAFANQGIHLLDQLVWLMGDPEAVLAHTATINHDIETEDYGVAVIRFKKGIQGLIHSTTTYPKDDVFTLDIHGSEGAVRMNGYNGPLTWRFRDDRQMPEAELPAHPANTIEDFVAAVANDRAPAISGEEGRKSLILLEAIYESAREERWITI